MSEITYHSEGESPKIGVWGRRRLRFLKQHHCGVYTGLLLSGRLNARLEETDRSAKEMYDRLTRQYAEREGATEELKAQDQMPWMRQMNGIRERVEEAILPVIIAGGEDRDVLTAVL